MNEKLGDAVLTLICGLMLVAGLFLLLRAPNAPEYLDEWSDGKGCIWLKHEGEDIPKRTPLGEHDCGGLK